MNHYQGINAYRSSSSLLSNIQSGDTKRKKRLIFVVTAYTSTMLNVIWLDFASIQSVRRIKLNLEKQHGLCCIQWQHITLYTRHWNNKKIWRSFYKFFLSSSHVDHVLMILSLVSIIYFFKVLFLFCLTNKQLVKRVCYFKWSRNYFISAFPQNYSSFSTYHILLYQHSSEIKLSRQIPKYFL